MTLTLEAHFGGRVVLRPLSTFISGPWYYRRVLLAQEYSGRPVEMGAIRMKLAALPRKVQAEIRRNQVPLGRILRDGGVDFTSMPREFFAVDAEPRDDGRLLDARAAHALRPPHRGAARRPRHRRHRRSAPARLDRRIMSAAASTSPDVVVIGGGPGRFHRLDAARPARPPRPAVRARDLPALPHRRVADPRDLLGAEAARHAAEDEGQPLRPEAQRAVRQRQRQAVGAVLLLGQQAARVLADLAGRARRVRPDAARERARARRRRPRGRARARGALRGRARRRREDPGARRRRAARCGRRSSSTPAARRRC